MSSNQVPPDKSLGEVIRDLRQAKGLLLRDVATASGIDIAILSKAERGERRFSRDVVLRLARLFETDPKPLLIMMMRDAVLADLENEILAPDVLQAAEAALVYEKAMSDLRPSLPGKAQIVSSFADFLTNHPAVCQAWVFGSFARGDETHDSDVDIALNILEEVPFTLFDLAEVKENLERLSKRKVDVVILHALRPGMRARVDKEKQLIYERFDHHVEGTD